MQEMVHTEPLIDHQDPQRIKWFNERVAGESLK